VIERSIVWNEARIGAGAIVRDTIVGEGYTVAEGATLADTIVANEPTPA
jgi:NDP-sugar pyrophosphorylase family protein